VSAISISVRTLGNGGGEHCSAGFYVQASIRRTATRTVTERESWTVGGPAHFIVRAIDRARGLVAAIAQKTGLVLTGPVVTVRVARLRNLLGALEGHR
jgi:hypothetical protein